MPEPSAASIQSQLLAELKRMGPLTFTTAGRAIILGRAREDCTLAQMLREKFANTAGIEKVAERLEQVAAHRRALADGWEKFLKENGEI